MSAVPEHRLTVPRNARYFTLGAPSRDVWFLLHGYGQLAERFLRDFRPLDDGTRLLVAPEGLSRFYVDRASHKVGASWMTREDRLAEIDDYVRYLDAVCDAVLRGAPPDPRVHVLGFSQGTATASRWLVQGAARAERLILWGGEVPPDLGLEREPARNRLRALALTIVAGNRDEYITPKVLARDTARLDDAAIPYRVVRFDGGHEIDEGVLRQLAATG